jgi:outer membrane immunogenic protein
MKKLVLAAVAAFCFANAAAAADMTAPVSLFAPVQYAANTPTLRNWTGLYVGVNAAYGSGTSYDTTSTGGGGNFKDSFRGKNGGIYGGTVGFNYQMGRWVVGLESDLGLASGFSADRGSSFCLDPGCLLKGKTAEHERLQWLGTLRARAGSLFLGDKLLAYGTGGLAFGGVKDTTTFKCTVCTPVQTDNFHPAVGWTLGAGLEYALSAHWSAKAEYLHYDLRGDKTVTKVMGVGTFTTSTAYRGDLVKLGLNYQF